MVEKYSWQQFQLEGTTPKMVTSCALYSLMSNEVFAIVQSLSFQFDWSIHGNGNPAIAVKFVSTKVTAVVVTHPSQWQQPFVSDPHRG